MAEQRTAAGLVIPEGVEVARERVLLPREDWRTLRRAIRLLGAAPYNLVLTLVCRACREPATLTTKDGNVTGWHCHCRDFTLERPEAVARRRR